MMNALRTGLCLLILGVVLADGKPAVRVRAETDSRVGALCTIAAQMESAEDCPQTGPAATRVEYALAGLWPRRPMPARAIAEDFKTVNRSYAAVSKDYALPVFATIEDAIRNNPVWVLEKGFVYISFVDVIKRDEGKFLITGSSLVVRRDDVSPISTHNNQFRGVELAEHPPHPFGWIIRAAGVVTAPAPAVPAGAKAPFYSWYDRLEIFDTQHTNGADWYMVQFGEWIRQYSIGVVFPSMARPAGIPQGAKWISVNLYEQTLSAFEGERLVFATLAATGLDGMWTRPGTFQIFRKLTRQNMSGAFEADRSDYYFVEDVPWVMYYDGARALHGAYWHNVFGLQRSHGCVNLSIADAHWLYDWAPEGTWVHVHDPSGKTPTDDATYAGDAGAP